MCINKQNWKCHSYKYRHLWSLIHCFLTRTDNSSAQSSLRTSYNIFDHIYSTLLSETPCRSCSPSLPFHFMSVFLLLWFYRMLYWSKWSEPLAGTLFLPPLLLCSLSLRYKRSIVNVFTGVRQPIVNCLHFDHV